MKKIGLLLSPKDIASTSIRRAWVYIFSGLLISAISILFHAELSKLFFTLPNISGWDGAAHEAIIDVYSKANFPSSWGWLSNWQGGMPFPILYPPLMYMVGALFTQLIGNSLIAYKFFSALILVCLSVSVVMSLRFFYEKEPAFKLDAKRKSIDWGLFTTIIAGVSIILALNTGSPGPKSIFLNSMIGQNLSMIFLIPALFSLTSRSKFFAVIGAVSWTLIYLSNIHTALSGIAASFFILIFQKRSDIFFFFKRYVFIHGLGILGASFWILPMLGSYTYFSGSVQPTTPDILILLSSVWPHLFIALSGLYISFAYTKDTSHTIFRWFAALFATAIFTACLYAFEQIAHIHIPLPIYFHRWFETYFFLMVIPYVYALIFILRHGFNLTDTKFKIKGIYIVSAIFILTLIPYIIKKHDLGVIYTRYEKDEVVSFSKKIAKEEGLTMVVSRPMESGQHTKPLTLDAEIGRYGGQTTFSNLRESSVNGSFLRMARNSLSNSPENWSLISYYSPSFSPYINAEDRASLFRHLGIRRLVLTDDVYPNNSEQIVFATSSATVTSAYTLSRPVSGYKVATLKNPAPFASLVEGDIALYIGKNGYRERKITDVNYTRFEEMTFENNFNNNFFAVNVGVVAPSELERLGQSASFTVITDYDMYSEKAMGEYIEQMISSENAPHTIFLFDDHSETFKKLRETYARSTKVIFFDARSPSYPFDSIIKKIKSITASSTVIEIPLTTLTKNNTDISLVIPDPTTRTTLLNSKLSALQPEHPLTRKAQMAARAFKITRTQKQTELNKRATSWIFVRQSYHPNWVAQIHGEKLESYPAAPAFTIVPIDRKLLTATSTLQFTFDTPPSVSIGHILTLLTFLTLLTYVTWGTSTSLRKNHHHLLPHTHNEMD